MHSRQRENMDAARMATMRAQFATDPTPERIMAISNLALQRFEPRGMQVHLAGINEPWRKQRYTNATFQQAMLAKGAKICPLFSIPGVTIEIFRDDWLHCVDQGIGADFLGNLFVMVMKKFPGSKEAQATKMWEHIQKICDQRGIQDRMQSFRWNNVQAKTKKPPKLRGCNAATVRALIPFGHLIAQEFLSDEVPCESAAKCAAHHLLMCYQSLSKTSVFAHETLLHSSIAFALQFSTLSDITPGALWRVKPKMHRFLELCMDDCHPNLFWTYRDEDFGGSLGHQSKMKGSWNKASSFMQHGLDLFALKNPEPRIL